MISFRSLLIVAITLSPLTAAADIVGLTIGGGSWQASPEGSIGRSDIDLESTLNLDEQNNQFIFIALEHPVPLLPNIRVRLTMFGIYCKSFPFLSVHGSNFHCTNKPMKMYHL